ncbi:hypothetical protein EV207_14516 [Scopulibacillus darangshiensis]|uniref:Serine aminopeptidase S33 domain-containing protein n=1 Tax=Scopulibacillus darangshiensis TaxID=442528 RepID=A0A4R2NIP8_9BACL|nr:alpha/beta hydrolase [Scopulibacillus darangshiensis]TCP21162.1 hypothetical protein EV207_14516 [Scopulibacillus darangshiensis]
MEYPISLEFDGLTLRGTAHQPEESQFQKHPVVILFHGFTGSKTESHFLFVRFARELEKHGMGCVRFDFSGSGESEGSFADLTFSREVHEGKEILQMVKKLDWADPSKIMLTGFSMGGAVATQVAKEFPDDIHKLCLWAPAGRMNQLAKLYFENNLEMPNGNIDLGGLELGRGFYDDLNARDLYDGITAYANPVMIIHGTKDQTVPLEYGQKYIDVYVKNEAKIHLIEGADHVFSKLCWIEELFDQSVRFLAGEG